ncbi:MAG TPA: alkaline phosphatase family protein [Puia sp.]|nr:alkaline phosphatase family protein [Puia sp.]
MKFILPLLAAILFAVPLTAQRPATTRHLFIITIDGFRWQEVFTGADPLLIGNTDYVRDTALTRASYWDSTAEGRRKKLLPFFWNTIAEKGRLYGNRLFGNDVNVSNFYKISYPGYNEILTGHTNAICSPNLPVNNKNVSVLEWLDRSPEFHGKVAIFTSWNVFPYILNESRSRLPINSGYAPLAEKDDPTAALIDSVSSTMRPSKTRHDQLTFLSAREYIALHHPSVLFLAFGETDECAHQGRYDLYLQQAADIDRMIADLWYEVQTDPYYKDNTTFLITTDHGRGRKPNKWTTHGFWAGGSGDVWMAVLGGDIRPGGELRNKDQVYQKQIAPTISGLLGDPPMPGHPPGRAIPIPVAQPALPPAGMAPGTSAR